MTFFLSLGQAFKEIGLAFVLKPYLWWQLAPVLLLWLLLEIYLSQNKREALGWNSALANAITLFWISLAAVQPLFWLSYGEPFRWGVLVVLVLFTAYALFLAAISFTHKFGAGVTYVLAAPVVVDYLSLFAILWGNGVLAVNLYILLAAVLLWLAVFGLRWLLFRLLPEAQHVHEEEFREAMHEIGESIEHAGKALEKRF